MPVKTLLDTASKYLPPEKVKLIETAYDFAAKAHDGQERRSGGPFIQHPLAVAQTLADLQLDSTAIQAALLHDVPEDSTGDAWSN